MNCPYCNAMLRDGARFCGKCGTPIDMPQASSYGQAPQQQTFQQPQPYQQPQQQAYQQPQQQAFQQPQPYQQPAQPRQTQPVYQAPQPAYQEPPTLSKPVAQQSRSTTQPTPQAPASPDDGKGKAVASLVCGIIGVVLDFLFAMVFMPALGCILGIVGCIMASQAKKLGFTGGMATGGLVLSIIAIVFGAGALLCVACAAGTLGGAAATMGAMN